MANRTLLAILAMVAAVAAASAFELKKTPMHKPHHDNKPTKDSNERLTKEDVRKIAREEIAIAAAGKANTGLPASPNDDDNKNATYRSAEIVLINQEGVRVDFSANDGAYRDIPTTMCSASAIGASTASNQAAFVTSHNTYRSQVNSCQYKLPTPSPALANTISSTAMATQADSWAQNLKTNQQCGLVHSSSTVRTVSFTLDNGTVVTNQYTGENLAQMSVCVALSDTSGFNSNQATYCSNGYIYKKSADMWFAEQTAYSNANNGNFATQAQLDAGLFSKTGHFTQMAWASSKVIAGGAAECSSLSTQTWTCSPPGATIPGYGTCSSSGTLQVQTRCFTWVVAGRYFGGGNYNNQNPYSSSGTVCSPPSG